jgi:hypothetical protein
MWHEDTDQDKLSRFGEKIVKELWPGFHNVKEEANATYLDKKGIDGWLNTFHTHSVNGQQTVQIKTDTVIAESKNFYKEHYKKTFGTSIPLAAQDWRISPIYADYHIFVTAYKAYIVTVHAFALAAIGRRLTKINDSSIGVLVPMSEVDIKEERDHRYSLDPSTW